MQLAVKNYLASVLARLWAPYCYRLWAAKFDCCSDSDSAFSAAEAAAVASSTAVPLNIISSKQTGLPGIIVRDYSNGSPVDQEFDSFMDAGRAYQSLRFKCHRAELVVGGVVKESFGCE